jgi:hypothetical protein
MQATLAQLLHERVLTGLQRKSITKVSDWAAMYRVMGPPYAGLFGFDHHPWLLEPHDCTAEMQIAKKSAQMGFTETGLNKAFKALDIDGKNVLYVLPTSHPDATDFSSSRFDPALELSQHLADMFTEVKNVGHKRAGSANLFVRGSRSRNQLKSIPANTVIFDELDEMVQKNITLAYERTSGQPDEFREIFKLSTPTIDEFGIDGFYKESDQRHYVFKCPHCTRFTELVFDSCLVVTAEHSEDPEIRNSYVICTLCKHKLDHRDKINFLKEKAFGGTAHWEPMVSNRMAVGWYINQLYSIALEPWKIAQAKLKMSQSPEDEQEYYNSKGGLTHVVAGGRVEDDDLKACTGNYLSSSGSSLPTLKTMGIDVGAWIHFEVDEWTLDRAKYTNNVNGIANCRVLKEGKVKDFHELDDLMFQYGIKYAVIDIEPEVRLALEFAQRFHGIVRRCRFARGVSGKDIKDNEEELSVQVCRTSWMDLALKRFHRRKITIPSDTGLEFKTQVKVPVRIYAKDADGNPVGRWESGNKADHAAFARVYSEIALKLAVSHAANSNI